MAVATEEKSDKQNVEPMDITESNDTPETAKEDPLAIFHAAIDEVISKSQLKSSDYNALGEIARDNPLAIESKLHEIFKKILLGEKSHEDDKLSFESLMSDIIDAVVRLRRDQKIVSWILIALDQSLKNAEEVKKISGIDLYVLPNEFLAKFSVSISNLTHSQSNSVLASLTYHLDSILIKSTDEKAKPTFSMQSRALVVFSEVAKQLTIAFLEGVDLFDSTWPLAGKQKFVTGLGNLGSTLAKLFKSLKRKVKDRDYIVVSVNLWKIVEVWQTMTAFVKHYAPDAVSDNDWNSILNSIKSSEDSFRKIEKNEVTRDALGFLKLKENKIEFIANFCNGSEESEPKNEKAEDLEEYWRILLDKYPQTIKNLNNLQISKLSELLIENLDTCKEKLATGLITNNERLVTALIFQIFKKISEILIDSNCVTQKLTDKTGKSTWEHEKHQKILKSYKKILIASEWAMIEDNKTLKKLLKHLKLLLDLPLMYCNAELKTIIFLTIISLKKETNHSSINDSCLEILSDISEKYNEDLLQYIQPEILIPELSNSPRILARIIESSLTNPANYETLKKCIKSHIKDITASTMIVECIDKVKSKLKTPEDKKLLVKFEKKLYKKILSEMNDDTLSATHLKSLTVALKTAVALKKIDESLTNKINAALKALIGKNDANDDLKFSKESYQLIKTVLQYRKNGVPLDKMTIKDTWSLMLEKSCNEIVPSLIEASDMKILTHALNFLRKQTLKSLHENNEDSFENCMIIWNSIAKSDMGANREKIRQNAFQGLMQSMKTTESSLNTNMKLNIVKLFTNIVSSKRMIIPDKTIDLILLVANSFMNEPALTLSQQTLELCSAFLKFRPAIAVDNLPIVTRLYLKSIQIAVEDARKNSEHQQLHCLITLEIQKLASAFVKLKKDIARLSPYIIADLIAIYYGGGVIPNYVKEPLDDSVSQFLSICDQHAISLLSRALPPSMQEIFKTLYDTYIKFYKFTGKV